MWNYNMWLQFVLWFIIVVLTFAPLIVVKTASLQIPQSKLYLLSYGVVYEYCYN